MVGKNPHRPEGKAADNERMQAGWQESGAAHDANRNDKARMERDLERMERGGHASITTEEYQVGGSRPGVPSRVKEAIAEREEGEQ
jgi:hypothetical protein